MLHQALRSAPQSVVSLIEPSLGLALVSLHFSDLETLRAVLTFINSLASTGAADQLFRRLAQPLLTSIVECITRITHDTVIYHQSADLLYILLNRIYADDEAAKNCVGHCVLSISSPFLSDADKQRFHGLLWRLKPKRRFTAMIIDLGYVLAGEMTADILLSYEM